VRFGSITTLARRGFLPHTHAMPVGRVSATRVLRVATLLALALASASACGSTDESVHAAGPSAPVSASDPTHEPNGPLTPLATPVIPSPAKAGANRALAKAEAAQEIKNFPVPPGSISIDAPPPGARYLERLTYFNLPVNQSLTRTRFWLIPQGIDPVVAWYAHHFPADRDTASYHPGGRLAPKAAVHWQPHARSKAFSPPTKVVSYIRLGPHLTAIRADVTLAARADRTSETLILNTVTSLEIGKWTIDRTGTDPTTVTTTDQGSIFRVIDAFNHVAGDYASSESFGCGSPTGTVHIYSVTFHWPGHTLAVGAGEPLCDVGRKLTLDGAKLPQHLANSHLLNSALKEAFDRS
jgi:hypothetical protein